MLRDSAIIMEMACSAAVVALPYPARVKVTLLNLLGQEVAQSSGFMIVLPERSGLYVLTNGVDRVVVLAE